MLMQAMGTKEWRSFAEGAWNRQIDVRDFIVRNVSPYTGGPEFLTCPTDRPDIGHAMIFPGMTIVKILFVDIAPAFFR